MQNKLILTTLLAVAACGGDDHVVQPDAPVATPDAPVDTPPASACATTPSQLRTDLPWYGTNRETLTTWIDSAGCQSPTYDKNHKPVALFDWDNTISKNDFGDAITYWFIAKGKVRQPPNKDWSLTNPYLTPAAVAALTAACGTATAAGDPLPMPTATNHDCADEMLNIYDNEETRAHEPAFDYARVNSRRLEPDYAWTPQLMAGYTHAEVQAEVQAMLAQMLAASDTTTQTIGTTEENGWLRIYDQMKDLVHALQTRGYDVWIITASPQDVIGTAAQMIDVPFDHVIGIRSMTDANGKLLYTFEGCGDVPDGQAELIPYIQGKRCFVNKAIWGETTNAFQRRPDGQRQFFAAGDSDSDVEFLRDATYKLVINRNKSDLMCHAYYDENDSWRVNPMFIGPKGARATPYPCSSSSFTDEHGSGGPSRDEGGNVIPDQADTVHP